MTVYENLHWPRAKEAEISGGSGETQAADIDSHKEVFGKTSHIKRVYASVFISTIYLDIQGDYSANGCVCSLDAFCVSQTAFWMWEKLTKLVAITCSVYKQMEAMSSCCSEEQIKRSHGHQPYVVACAPKQSTRINIQVETDSPFSFGLGGGI